MKANNSATTVVLFFLTFAAVGRTCLAADREEIQQLLDSAATQKDFAAAAEILAPLFRDPEVLRAAYSMLYGRRDLAAYVLLDTAWLPKDPYPPLSLWGATLAETIAAEPRFVRDVLRVYRHRMHYPRGHMTGQGWPYFAPTLLHDGIIHHHLDSLRDDVNVAPHAIIDPRTGKPLLTKNEREWHLLYTWQLTAGLSGRLDLVKGSVAGNWRGRFEDLDKWYNANRRFLRWNENLTCFEVDADRKANGTVSPKEDRQIPDPGPYKIEAAPDNKKEDTAADKLPAG